MAGFNRFEPFQQRNRLVYSDESKICFIPKSRKEQKLSLVYKNWNPFTFKFKYFSDSWSRSPIQSLFRVKLRININKESNFNN